MTTQTRRVGRRRLAAVAVAVPLSLGLGVGAMAAPPDHANTDKTSKSNEGNHGKPPELEARVKDIITFKGRQFKDLNSNGELDPYEDWRLPVEQRVADLVGQMELAEKAGLMLINTLNAACQGTVPASVDNLINTQQMHRFVFRNVVAAESSPCTGSGTVVTPSQAATFTNSVQEMGEATRLGIPVLFKSNARNHIEADARFGINEASGAFSAFPKEAGIASAALGDAEYMDVVEDFAGVMGEEWSSIGLRGMYGYMADLSTDPRWYRVHETFTEDGDLNADIMRTLVQTLQGPIDTKTGVSLSPDTDVALTLKHFPGGGPQELGLDPHYAFGKTQVYGDGGFELNLKPFIAAIDAGVSSIMPYYGVPITREDTTDPSSAPGHVVYNGRQFPWTGFAFSEDIVNGLLRDELGFAGYVNSDTGIINDRAWGLETATVSERVAAAINGGTDTLSGFSDVNTIIGLVDTGLVSEERVAEAAVRLLTPLFHMGLFENPYVDAAAADTIVGKAENIAMAQDIQRKSVVLLQNDNDLLPLAANSTLFMMGDYSKATVEGMGFTVVDGNTEDPALAADADYVVINVTARNAGANAYRSNDPATGLNPGFISPIVLPGFNGLDGESPYGAADACVAYPGVNVPANGQVACTDNGLRFGGSFPWETSILDFTGMEEEAASWAVQPGLAKIQEVMEVAGPEKVVLNVYFRQPYVLDEASGLLDAGAIVAGFGVGDTALFDVLSGRFAPQGKLPFALPATRLAVEQQRPDLPGYEETDDGALFEFGFGLTY